MVVALSAGAAACGAANNTIASPAVTETSATETSATETSTTESSRTVDSADEAVDSAEADTVPETHEDEQQESTNQDVDGQQDELFPDVVGVDAEQESDGTWEFSVTLSSPYDSPERYADAWRVVGPDGTVYGERIVGHDHATEQPFTRSQSGIAIPDGVSQVLVEGRDQVSGWGGATLTYVLP